MEFSLSQVHEAIAAEYGARECIVQGPRRLSFAQVAERTRRLAHVLAAHGLGLHRERAGLAGWESGQDHVALYLHNAPEYLESMLGAFKARAVPFNVNYRYVEEELGYLLRDATTRAVIFHAAFAPLLARVLEQLPPMQLLLQVDDGSATPLLPGALAYERALAEAPTTPLPITPSPDDLYMLYTGGTTGMPKGVLWRQGDVFVAALGGKSSRGELGSLAEVVARAQGGAGRLLATPPLMHGAAHWAAFHSMNGGGTVVLQDDARKLDAADILRTAERERVTKIIIVGDAFGRPLGDELRRRNYDLGALTHLINSGAPLGVGVKQELLERVPALQIFDTVGASETGPQAATVSRRGDVGRAGSFALSTGGCVISEDMTRVLAPGHEGLGWLAQEGHVPLGYLGDAEKTRRTFPVVGGVRMAVPGDRARLLADGTLELHGRDSVTINSGGEKIFAEEVEAALKRHPDVYDAVVCGRPSERWGQEVCAIVQLRQGAAQDARALLAECEKHIARYKLPKLVLFRAAVQRSPSGKADYRWARQQAQEGG